ncbi:divergent polysaccharide deacetylase family protein [Magnetococcus sp. PR-3]|uniref:divergent polysaccharide deacetylase family protein n=1 Tax=Magnetococcus sp. PR-3 TaxID=3120355 RepID=UPI002FCE1B7E
MNRLTHVTSDTSQHGGARWDFLVGTLLVFGLVGFIFYLWVAGPWSLLDQERLATPWGTPPYAEEQGYTLQPAMSRIMQEDTEELNRDVQKASLVAKPEAIPPALDNPIEDEPAEPPQGDLDAGMQSEVTPPAAKAEKPKQTDASKQPVEVQKKPDTSVRQKEPKKAESDTTVDEKKPTPEHTKRVEPKSQSKDTPQKSQAVVEKTAETKKERAPVPAVKKAAKALPDSKKETKAAVKASPVKKEIPVKTEAKKPTQTEKPVKKVADKPTGPAKSESTSGIIYEEDLSDDIDKSEVPVVEEKKPTPTPSRMAKIAVIIDDLGYNGSVGRGIVRLPADITLAVLPGGPYSRQLVNMADKKGQEIILHQPMQPKGYPRVNPGPGALLEGMEPDEVTEILNKNLKAFPEVVGINNHMGSALTENRKVMNAVMKVLVRRELYFVDSRTSPRSVAYRSALAHGVPRAKRSVFLDNKRTVEAILKRLKETERIALRTGSAIAIGHPYGVTLKALKQWLPGLQKRGIMVVRASSLLAPESSRKWFKPER